MQYTKVKKVDPIRDARWDAYILGHEDASIYHHSAWARVLQDAYSYSPVYFALENDGEIVAVTPFYHIQSRLTGNRLICLPFSDWCFPLARRSQEVEQLLSAAKETMENQRISHLEIRGWGGPVRPDELGLVEYPYWVMHSGSLDPDPERLKERLHHRARRGIKQGENRGLSIREATTEADMKEFYRLNVATRRRHGILPQPYRFFRAIYRHIIVPGYGFLLLAEWQGRAIAGVIYLLFRNTITYKFNASDEDHLWQRPNHLLIWKGMERACQEGYRIFDFGRSTPENHGLRTFKGQWATEEKALPYYYYPAIGGISTVPEASFKYRLAAGLIRRLPESVVQLIGSAVYNHLA